MKRYASVRYGGALDASEREAFTRTLRCGGASPISWNATAAASYAGIQLEASCDVAALRAALPTFRIDAPPLVVLRVKPSHPRMLDRLSHALGGDGRPAGIVGAAHDGDALIVEIEPRRTALALVVALIDVELRGAPARTIEPLVPLDDATLAAFVGDVLAVPELDTTRIIETHVEPLLASARP